MKLYTFFRSSASYRVRIALNLKGLKYEQAPIHLRRGGGEQLSATYKAINPQALVPALEDDGKILTQSLAIIEYLEERYPQPPLLPRDPADKALVRSMALIIACEIHPIQNLRAPAVRQARIRPIRRASESLGCTGSTSGLAALEQMIVRSRGARVLLRRHADLSGHLSRAPAGQRAALRLRSVSVPCDHRDREELHGSTRFRRRRTGKTTRRGIMVSSCQCSVSS
jgi:maleylpyruvate isomerase